MSAPNATVTRVPTASGSRIEPPLDQCASELTKLQWATAVLLIDTGIEMCVTETRAGLYALGGTGWGISAMSFRDCWTYINGVDKGAELAVRP